MAKTLRREKSKPKSKKSRKSAESRTNERARDVVIREACRKLAEIERDRDALNDRSKIVTNMLIKGELGMTKKNFMLAYGQALLEPEERAELLGTVREVYAALKVGEQVDWLKVVEDQDRETVAAMPEPISADPAKAYDDGYKVGLEGGSMTENTFDAKKAAALFKRWDQGHHDGLMARIEKMGTAAAEPTQDAAE